MPNPGSRKIDPRRFGLMALGLALWAAVPAQAQRVPTGYQEYFVLGREQQVWDMLWTVATGEGQASFDNSGAYINGINSVVSATASADNQIIYYDHWEDGLDPWIDDPVGNPVPQGTTLVIGDGDPANGDACTFNASGCGVDLLAKGDYVNFRSDQGLPGVTPNPNPNGSCQGGLPVPGIPNDPANWICSVPVNPRGTVIRFDGGDRIFTSGGPLALVHPMDPLSPYIGGATEIISRQTVAEATSYSIPVGENIYGGDGSVTEPFKYVFVDLVAFEDGTQVFIDSPGAGGGTVSFTLDRGEHYSSRGFIEESSAPAIRINAGAKVSTSAPIAGMIFSGGDGNFATRIYTLLPDRMHSTDYVTTAPGDDPAVQTSRPLNLYILNPDPYSAIDVTVTDTVGSTTINIPANSQQNYRTGTGRFVPNLSTVRLTSNRNFWGVSAYDHSSPSNDWGHSWLANRFVTENYTVSYAPGVTNPAYQSLLAQRLANDPACTIPPAGPGVCDTLNRSPVFVAATQDNTLVQVDFDNDGSYDVIDSNGDDYPDPAPRPNNTYVINALQALRIYDHTDYDNTGTLIVTNKPVAVAYGQDTDQATGPDPIQDTGYAVYPTNQLFLDPVLTIDKDVDTTTVRTTGGIATYTLTIRSYDFGPLDDLQVYDLLPPGVSSSDYIPGSTLITYPNLTQDTTDPTLGTGRLDWSLTPSPYTLQANRTLTVRYSVNIPAAPGDTPRLLTNEGHAVATLGGSTFEPFATAKVVQTDIVLQKSASATAVGAGDVITFTLNVWNLGLPTETNPVISDAIPANATYCDSTTPVPPGGSACTDPTTDGPFDTVGFDTAQNAVVWTPSGGSFAPGGPYVLTFDVRVNPAVAEGTPVPNRAGYESTETPYFLSNQVEPVVVGPLLEISKTGPSILRPNEVATFTITVRNNGAAPATNLTIVDPFPANVTYVPESMEWQLNASLPQQITDAADGDEGTAFADRVEFVLGVLGPNEDVAYFEFKVRVNAGTAGQFVNNQATVTSDELVPTDTNLVRIPVSGSANSDITGHVFLDTDGNGVQDPGEPDLANIDVVIQDGAGTQIVTTDAGGDYLATVIPSCYSDVFTSVAYNGSNGVFDWSGNAWTEFGTVADGDPATPQLYVRTDPLTVYGNSLLIEGGPAASDRGFTRAIDLSNAGVFGVGNTTLSFNYRRVSLEATDVVTVEIDYDNDGTFDDLVGTYTNGTDAAWQTASFTLAAGSLPANPVVLRFYGTNFNFNNDNFYVDNVSVCGGSVTANVDESDPDFPAGAVLTTGNDPQSIAPVVGGTAAATPVGYQPPPLTFTKTSDAAGHEVFPGQTITYTLSATNTTGTTQTGVTISDPLPAGTTWVPGSTQIPQSNLRVNEYLILNTAFSGNSYNLTLAQALAPDYFAIVQGSDGDGSSQRGPDENYASLTADPFGTGQLAASGAADVITLTRHSSVDGWLGVVTVVECLSDCATNGFNLLDVRRVTHTGNTTAGNDNATVGWTDINQVMLLGGFNGAGCDTVDPDAADTNTCHARIWPSGGNQINWTRNGLSAGASTATSTVMVLEWGSAWTVQRRRIQGNNGGDGADAAGEYNTAAISFVSRANTWVWGTGHTSANGLGNAAEGVLLTLGNGVVQNATEGLVAAGIEYAGNNLDLEVYALTHPDLGVDYAFKTDGDGIALTVDVAVPAPGNQRMALSYNGQNGTGPLYPRPMFSARYFNDTTIRLQRRYSGQDFPAWVQGIDFTGIASTTAPASGGTPPNLIVGGDGVTIGPGQTLVVTFQVVVDDPLASGITQVTNQATLDTDQQPAVNASVTDDVVRLGVTVEPNNGNFVIFTGAPQTRTYSHVITNSGQSPDSYEITVDGELGRRIELIDTDTGAVIATDTDGNGTWDGPGASRVNTGVLAPGEQAYLDIRVTMLGTDGPGTQETSTLIATSDRSPLGLLDFATDETRVVGAAGTVALVSDQSGVVAAGGIVAYTHWIYNLTGSPDTFDLTAFPTLAGWTSQVYDDTNGDGVWNPADDELIANTRQLPSGGSQTFFIVVTADAGATSGQSDVTHVTARSRLDPDLYDALSDTTTVVPATTHDLSGGDTLLVQPGDACPAVSPSAALCPTFPGTIKNLRAAADRFELSITASAFYGRDGLDHPTQLWIDTTGDGVADTRIAEDTDGDGDWDYIDPGYNSDIDSTPDVPVPGNGELAYELRRPVDPLQGASRDPVTLTAQSQATGEVDRITATNLLAAATLAVLSGFEARLVDDQVLLEWTTASELGTAAFELFRKGPGDARFVKITDDPIPGLVTAPQGGTYRFVDPTAAPGDTYAYRLVELEVWGSAREAGEFIVWIDPDGAVASASADELAALQAGHSEKPHRSLRKVLRLAALAATRAAGSRPALAQLDRLTFKVGVRERGLVHLSAAEISATTALPVDSVAWLARRGWFDVRNLGRPVSWQPDPLGDGIYFFAEAIDSIYTNDNVYWVKLAIGRKVKLVAGDTGPIRPVTGAGFPEHLHLEQEAYPVTSVVDDPDSDFWFWDYFYVAKNPATKSYTLSTPDPVAGGPASLTVRLLGQYDSEATPDHHVTIRLNGTPIGETSWDGAVRHSVELSFDAGLLNDGANTLELTADRLPGVSFDYVYLDSFDIAYQRAYRASGDALLAPAKGLETLSVDGFTTGEVVVFDVTRPNQPQRVRRVKLEDLGGQYRASFHTHPKHTYLATTLAAAGGHEGFVLDTPSNLRARRNAAEYVVIAGPGLEEAAEDLAALRRAQGLTALVAPVVDVYDEFNHGIVSPWAIRDFLAHAVKRWRQAPRFVVLLGDGSFDYKDAMGLGGNLIPPPMARTPEGLFTSDNRIADLEGNDGVPEVAIGRIPALSLSEAAAYVTKLDARAAAVGTWSKDALWVADNPDQGGEFSHDADRLLTGLPSRYRPRRLYVEERGAVSTRQQLLRGVGDGAGLVNYLGHGGMDRLADEGLMLTADVPLLANGPRYPVMLTLTCVVGRYGLPGFEGLGEALVLQPDGGAVALWGPTGASMNLDAMMIGAGFLRAMARDGEVRIGVAVRESLRDYLAEGGELPYLPFIYNVLGDPAVEVAAPAP